MRFCLLLFVFLILSCEVNVSNQRTINAQGFESVRRLSLGKQNAALVSFPLPNGNTVFEIRGSIFLNKEKEWYSCYFKKNPVSSGESPFLINLPEDLSTVALRPENISFKIVRNRDIELELKTGSKRLFIRDRISAAH